MVHVAPDEMPGIVMITSISNITYTPLISCLYQSHHGRSGQSLLATRTYLIVKELVRLNCVMTTLRVTLSYSSNM